MSQKKDIRQASQIWSALDNLAKTDPIAYRAYIKDQIEQGKKMTSAPTPDLLIRISTRNIKCSSIYILICSWSRLPSAVKDEDPLNVIGGQSYKVSDEKSLKTAQTLLYPLAFSDDIIAKYGSSTSNNQAQLELIEMCIDFLKKEKKVNIDSNSMYEICSEKMIGSVDDLHSSFGYKPFNPETEFKDTFGDLSASREITLTREEEQLDEELTELKLGKTQKTANKVLIEEVDEPIVSTDQQRRQITVEVFLPCVSTLSEVELDISEAVVHLEIPSQTSFKAVHLTLPAPILVASATAKFMRKRSKLVIVANMK